MADTIINKEHFYFSDDEEEDEVIDLPVKSKTSEQEQAEFIKQERVEFINRYLGVLSGAAAVAILHHHEDEIEHPVEPNVTTAIETVKSTVFGWYKSLNERIAARLQEGGADAKTDAERIIKDAREEVPVIIHQAKRKASNTGWAANEKADAELESALQKVQGSVLEHVTEVEMVVMATTDIDVINKTLAAATEKVRISIDVHLDKPTAVIHEHVEKSKSHAGAIAGTIDAGTAIVGGAIAKKHHDEKKESIHTVEETHDHVPADVATDVVTGVIAGGIAPKKHHTHDEETKMDHPHHYTSAIIGGALAIGAATAGVIEIEEKHEKAFDIVLVNIKKAAEKRYIQCDCVPMDGKTPYVALSYRWGELDEQMVPATHDYNARITSFHLQDFFKLCQALRHEPDLKHIDYVWVDAICVNQQNKEKQKATIYRMNEIYICSTAIVAVPDLHAYHISITTTANKKAMATIQKHRRYLYYLLVGTPEAQQELIKMDHAWMDALGVPPLDIQRRELVTATQQPSRGISSNIKKNGNTELRDTTSSFVQQMMALMLHRTPPETASNNGQRDMASDQELSCRMMVEFQRFEWQQQMYQRKTDLVHSIEFLQSLMEDWSNRTWVISEYHIAKKKKGSKLKFWYNQLSSPELDGCRFFEFDFNSAKKVQQQNSSELLYHDHPYTGEIFTLTRQFENSMRHRLTKRTVLEMMLQSRASKSIDRFHAIIPLSPNYMHHIKDRNTIAELGISNILSVRLKLMEWINTKDRLNLLFSGRQPLPSPVPLLPTFATYFEHIKPGLNKLLTHPQIKCNFDISDDNNNDDESVKCVRFVRAPAGGGLDELWLCPRVYHAWDNNDNDSADRHSFYDNMGGKSHEIWQTLGLDPENDPLDAISIPLFLDVTLAEDNDSLNALLTSDMQLIGSWEKNCWVLYSFCLNYQDGKIHPSRVCQMDRLANGFRIY